MSDCPLGCRVNFNIFYLQPCFQVTNGELYISWPDPPLVFFKMTLKPILFQIFRLLILTHFSLGQLPLFRGWHFLASKTRNKGYGELHVTKS